MGSAPRPSLKQAQPDEDQEVVLLENFDHAEASAEEESTHGADVPVSLTHTAASADGRQEGQPQDGQDEGGADAAPRVKPQLSIVTTRDDLDQPEAGDDADDSMSDFGASESDDEEAIKNDEITRLAAILCDLPKHGLYSPESRSLGCCGVGGSGGSGIPAIQDADDDEPSSNGVVFTAADAVQVALLESSRKYPDYTSTLQRLVVEFANADIAIFADHLTQRIFLSIRGTDPFTPRDIGNDALVFLGMSPARIEDAKRAYGEFKQKYPCYTAYGCGHSLGGTIMHELACDVSYDEELAFRRVDVFNAGGSPLRCRRVGSIKEGRYGTQYHAHRVSGDLVSLFYEPPTVRSPNARSRKIEHELVPKFHSHRLGHFLPPRRRTTLAIIEDRISMFFGFFCMASRQDTRALF